MPVPVEAERIKLWGDIFMSDLPALLGLQTVHTFTGCAMDDHIKARKDVFYRLKNNPKICWRVVLWMSGMKFMKLTANQGEHISDSPRCLVFDDSVLPKTGRHIEKIPEYLIMYQNVLFLGISY